jgi:hypothetical protein
MGRRVSVVALVVFALAVLGEGGAEAAGGRCTAAKLKASGKKVSDDTRKMIEIDWSQGVPVFAATARASVGYVR